MFGNSNGLHLLSKLWHGHLDGFSIVILTQFSTTKSKSTLFPSVHSFLKDKISTTRQHGLPTHRGHSVVSSGDVSGTGDRGNDWDLYVTREHNWTLWRHWIFLYWNDLDLFQKSNQKSYVRHELATTLYSFCLKPYVFCKCLWCLIFQQIWSIVFFDVHVYPSLFVKIHKWTGDVTNSSESNVTCLSCIFMCVPWLSTSSKQSAYQRYHHHVRVYHNLRSISKTSDFLITDFFSRV